MVRYVVLGLLSLSLIGCGFHFQNNAALPSAIRSIKCEGDNALFVSRLQNYIQPNQAKSNTRLSISHYRFNQSQASSYSSSYPQTFAYTLSLKAMLYYKNKEINSHNFTANVSNINSSLLSKWQPLNPEQEQQLQNNIIQQIYYWLQSSNINQAMKKTHAN